MGGLIFHVEEVGGMMMMMMIEERFLAGVLSFTTWSLF